MSCTECHHVRGRVVVDEPPRVRPESALMVWTKRHSLFESNGSGHGDFHSSCLHVPLRYLLDQPTQRKGSNMVLIEINGSTVVYGYRNNDRGRVGMLRTAKLIDSKRGQYFVERGKKIFPFKNSPFGWVL